MKLAVQHLQLLDLALSGGEPLAAILGMPGQLVIVSFRGTRLLVLAGHDGEGQRARSGAPVPVTDPLHLELLTGPGEAPAWHRPVALRAVLETGQDPVIAIQRASRWASYAARVAVVPQVRLNDQALLEARLRGVWVVTADKARQFEVAAAGEKTATKGSARGLAHRLLDELTWEALLQQDRMARAPARPAATR